MEPLHKANAFRGQAIGAAFFTGFGTLWIGLSLYIRQQLSPMNLSLLTTGFIALSIGCFLLYSEAKHWPSRPVDPATSRAFNRVNAAQWIAIILVAFTFARLRIDAYVLSAITAIVGVHLFPLATIFRRKLHMVTGIAMVLWASVTVLAVPVEHMQGVTALGTGIILWTSAAISLAAGIHAARRTPTSDSVDQSTAQSTRQSTLAV
jgi:hypothetical protein